MSVIAHVDHGELEEDGEEEGGEFGNDGFSSARSCFFFCFLSPSIDDGGWPLYKVRSGRARVRSFLLPQFPLLRRLRSRSLSGFRNLAERERWKEKEKEREAANFFFAPALCFTHYLEGGDLFARERGDRASGREATSSLRFTRSLPLPPSLPLASARSEAFTVNFSAPLPLRFEGVRNSHLVFQQQQQHQQHQL